MSDDVTSGTPPTPGAPPPSGTPPAGQPSEPWFASFQNQELKTYLSGKNFKTAEAMAGSYWSGEKKWGDPESLLLVPKDLEDEKAVSLVYDRLGRPKDPNGYELPIDEKTASEDDKATASWYKQTAHKLGLNNKQAKAFYEEAMARGGDLAKATAAAEESRKDKQQQDLEKEWGADYKKNSGVAQRARVAMGISDAELLSLENSELGVAGTLKFLHRIGSRLGEHGFVGAENGAPRGYEGFTAAQAQAELNRLKQDPAFVKEFKIKGSKAYEKAMLLSEIVAGMNE